VPACIGYWLCEDQGTCEKDLVINFKVVESDKTINECFWMQINQRLLYLAGSPFTVNVGGESSGRVRETVTKDIKEVSATAPGSKCEFQLKIPGTNPLNMEASLTSPTGKTDLCDIADKEHSLYDIKFVPREEGVHIVSLKHNGLHISGQSFVV
jgi:hypothetical protein